MEIAEPRVRPVSGPAGGAVRAVAGPPLVRPASAVPASAFRRLPNVPAVRLPNGAPESDADASSLDSSHSVGSLEGNGVEASPARREYERSDALSERPSGRSRSGRGTR